MGTENNNLEIYEFDYTKEKQWDEFIAEKSTNGTFLQMRLFLNYHKEGRFKDCSLMVYYKKSLIALCPACEIYENGEKVFYSHLGSTYGGFVFSEDALRLEIANEIVKSVDIYLIEHGFRKSILKPTMRLICNNYDDAFLFAMQQNGYKEYRELNLYLDYAHYNSDICANFSKLKKRQINKCIKAGMELREIESREDVEEFHAVLSENLKKFDKKPVHSVDELLDLKKRIKDDYHIYGGYLDGVLLSGTLVFEFPRAGCAHTQYLAARNMESNLSPMSYIYYSMAKKYFEKGYRYLSWGIATEHYGEGVNWGLMRNKEEFGSRHCMNYIYEKTF